VNPSLYAKVPYDPVKDFAPVTLVAVSPNVVVVNPQVPAKTLPELVQLVRDNPANTASPGPGRIDAASGRRAVPAGLQARPGARAFHGAGPAIQATVGGHTPIAFTALPPALSAVQSGQLRALGWRQPNVPPGCPTCRPSPNRA
jgi:tripartite-type tricarboxylate transporter receptor subunit TctC